MGRDAWRGLGEGPPRLGIVQWKVAEGAACEPHQSIASVFWGDYAIQIGVDSFGHVVRLLVPDGVEVGPGEPLAEFSPRLPTTDEYWEQFEGRFQAESRARSLERMLSNPFRAFWASLSRRHERE